MKKIILALMIAAGCSLTAAAQATKTSTRAEKKKDASPAERAKAEASHAEKKLGLSADQKSKWESASLQRINSNVPQREKLKGSTTPEERKAIHKEMRANKEKFDSSVNGFLTPEQKTKWDQMKEERKKKLREKHKGKKDDEIIDDED